MSQTFESILKLTFDPGGTNSVLLNIGDFIVDGPLRPSHRLGREITPSPDSVYPAIFDTLNHSFTLKFGRVDDTAATRTAAMKAVFDAIITENSRGVKALKIEISGLTGHYYTVAQCAVTDHEPYVEMISGKNRVIRGYSLACAGLSYT